MFITALAMSALSCRRPDVHPAGAPAAKGAESGASRRFDRVLHAGVWCHASASFCTASASLKSEFVI